MANEPSPVELYGVNDAGDIRRYTVASGTAIPIYTVMALTDPRTAIAHSSAEQPCAGIAASAKASDDTSTSMGNITNGIFEMTCSGAAVIGAPAVLADVPNMVKTGTGTTTSGAQVIGYFLEQASNGERVNVRVRL